MFSSFYCAALRMAADGISAFIDDIVPKQFSFGSFFAQTVVSVACFAKVSKTFHFLLCISHKASRPRFVHPAQTPKMAGCLILDPQPSIQLFCGSSTLSVNHSFSQCSVIVPPRFSAAARTPRRSLPPWVLRRGRPSAPSSTSCAQ